jgi:hypothetical protein
VYPTHDAVSAGYIDRASGAGGVYTRGRHGAFERCGKSAGPPKLDVALCGTACMLLREENQSLPVQSGKTHNSAKAFATCKIKRDHLVLSHAVEIAVWSEAQPPRVPQRC